MNECVICYELVKEDAQACGHFCHINCLKQHFKPECPVCRRKLNIKVEGRFPYVEIPFSFDNNAEEYDESTLSENEIEEYDEESKTYFASSLVAKYGFTKEEALSITETEPWKRDGYIHKEEHPDYDEENPDDIDEDFDCDYENNRYF